MKQYPTSHHIIHKEGRRKGIQGIVHLFDSWQSKCLLRLLYQCAGMREWLSSEWLLDPPVYTPTVGEPVYFSRDILMDEEYYSMMMNSGLPIWFLVLSSKKRQKDFQRQECFQIIVFNVECDLVICGVHNEKSV